MLGAAIDSPRYDTRGFAALPALEAVAVMDEERKGVAIFAVSRDAKKPLDLSMDLRGFGRMAVAEHRVLSHADLKALNGPGSENVKPRAGGGARIDGMRLEARLPGPSQNVIRLEPVPS